MRFSFRLITLLVLPTLAWADGPSDLRARLQRLHGHSPVTVSVDYSNWQEVTPFLKPVVSQESLHLRVGEDGSGLHVDWNVPHPDGADGELRPVRLGAQAMTPARIAMQEPDARWLDQLLNQAEVLTLFLDGSQFRNEGSELYQGKPARVLVFSFDPDIRPDHRGHVSHAEATFKVWMGEDGLPMATESRVDYSGKHTRQYGRFHLTSVVRTTYAVLGQRLVVASQTSEDLVYDTGEKLKSRKTLNLAAMG